MICRMLQWAMEGQLDRHGAIQSPPLLRHVQHCPACSRWLQTHQQLQRRLQHPLPSPVSPARISRLQARLQQRLSEAGRIRKAPFRPAALQSAAAVLLLGAGIGLLYVYYAPTAPVSSGAADALQLITPAAGWQQIPQWAALSEQPLRTEVSNLAADARRAMQFLVTCLPAGGVPAGLSDAAPD
ncbi:MAG: hypothetical protein KBI46_10245 [Phycisphaerae bacterium]|nr:hypothetical protein [Phycisphaerae bacterium]